MKTIRLTPQQRRDIGERRRHAPDRRIYQRLSAVLWSEDGRSREEIAALLGVSTRQVGQWLRIFRNKGPDELCTLHYQGDPGRLGPAQVGRIKQEIAKRVFHNAEQIRTWVEATFGVAYSPSGERDLGLMLRLFLAAKWLTIATPLSSRRNDDWGRKPGMRESSGYINPRSHPLGQQGPAPPGRGQLPQGLRLLVEGRRRG